MAPKRIDTIVRAVAAASSRRSLLGALAGGILALANLQDGADAPVEAAQKKKKKQPIRCPKSRRCKTKCCQRGQTCQRGVCRRRPRPKPDTTRVRPNLHSLTAYGPELNAFARGVAVMRQRPAGDPTSWVGQARIHAETNQHGTIHFLAWHRMYLYWFERILRQASGDPSFAIPYWDYSDPSQRVLPPPFRDDENALYESDRSDTVNRGWQPDEDDEWVFDTSDAFATVDFAQSGSRPSFGGGPDDMGAAEISPHNHIHNWVGGLMRKVPEAPNDPIFWIHHANIDRMWEAWLRRGGGRANPTSGPFLTTTFSFYDENGAQVEMTGHQILDTVDQLGYRYDDQPASAGARSTAASNEPSLTAKTHESTVLGAVRADDLTLGPRPVEVSIPVREAAGASFRAATPGSGARTTLALEGVAGGGVAGVTYTVHVGATTASPSSRDRSFVGAIGLFGLQPWDHPGHGHRTATMRFDVTDAIAAAGGDRKIAVTLVPVDLTGSGPLPAGTWATIERMVIAVDGAGPSGARKPTKPKQTRQRQRDGQGNGTNPPAPDDRPNPKLKAATARNEQRRNADKPERKVNQKQNRRGQHDRSHAAPADGPHHASAIPGSKHTSFSRDPAADAATTAETGVAHH